ncbi:50S ribosomal protein L5 [Candidatus Roizmanbacteria bacterium CG_4_8_14_3_um_filter_34_9]|uniref:Large ribosomal subunit protein uL5 n=3 Tax=Candidatus Roizmaniibacteriota TaxID=1752723 RepID=A0A2M7AV54_9BACT|nr:MAG: 50S ribosomal protein L5 [Candidatus Roizmanbacteria bacterium CG07_land_8_20_14_0_80_34_15]PIU74492.1 MAG: 50S ribosomal protein L5 [Candidatus Roizmanbacteria bacterium CG06_land_8_20_14_3_00_34_14]PIW73433.1 MAG: 50S ribosomal protein L5 [Candidatus Roizmanbacteria bacterium CG_4_8_14_3_um_filter_34_9]
MTFKDFYNQEVAPKLTKEFGVKNVMAVPKIIKIAINVGAGEAVTNKNVIEKIQEQISTIAGQKTVITKARTSVSAFKIRMGLPIGVKVTLRGKRMYHFLEKLIRIVIPRLKDFRGIPESNIDQNGNLNIGFPEQIIFPEIDFDKIDKIRGLQVTVVTNAKNKEKGKKLFEMLGIPFMK